MVNLNLKSFWKFLFSLVIVQSISSCAFIKSIWTARAPLPALVRVASSPAPDFSDIFNSDDRVASAAMNHWQHLIPDLFRKIEGHTQNALSFREIRILLESGVIKFGPNPKIAADRMIALLEFLGFRKQVTAEGVSTILAWLAEHQKEARSAWMIWKAHHFEGGSLNANDYFKIIDFVGSVLELEGSEPASARTLARWLDPWIPEERSHLHAGLKSGSELLISLSASFCGNPVDPSVWSGKKTGKCLHQFVEKFRNSAPVIDLLLGKLNPSGHSQELRAAVTHLSKSAHSWFKNHPGLPTDRILRFGLELSLTPLKDPSLLFSWAQAIDSRSTADALSPEILSALSDILSNTLSELISEIEAHPLPLICAAPIWTDCEFPGPNHVLDQFFDSNIHPTPHERSVGHLLKTILYQQIANWLIESKNPEEKVQIRENNAERMTLVIPQIFDFGNYLKNIFARIEEGPIETGSLLESIEAYPFSGLVNLVQVASEFIPDRNHSLPSSRPGLDLDEIGLAGLFYSYDQIRSMNPDTFKSLGLTLRPEGTNDYVKRKEVMIALPALLEHDFPRIYQACLDYGFSRTCDIVFDELIPDPKPGSDELEVRDLDIIPLAGIIFERLYHFCDLNHDGKLTSNRLMNEKKCFVDYGTRIAQGLMNAGFVKSEPKVRRLIKLTQSLFAVSWMAQVAITRGTLRGFRVIKRPATIGSIFSLLAEIMNPGKVAAVDMENREWHARRDSNTGPSH